MAKVTIDGQEVEVENGITILQACEQAGAEIPRFCYHERLSIAGNCRMCLVEVERSPKPVASCAMPVNDGMVVNTNTPKVKKAREGVLEFLLINHPLDCPICDQGGECDLQDQTMAYGHDGSRYDENKRAVEDKAMGPLVKTIMTRCIHCTRCIRFATEVAGVEELGAIGRGEDMEITTYLEQMLTSELSANVIDLCPVGALTSKPYAFEARPWELKKTETIDVMDAVGSNIRVDARGREVMRVLPRLHEDVNEEWISDKTRYACDGLKYQRLDTPYVKRDGKLAAVGWDDALGEVAKLIEATEPVKIAAIAGDLQDAESLKALKDLMAQIGSPHLDCRADGSRVQGPRSSYIFNPGIAGIEQADAILLIGTNPRLEAPILNARIRKRWLEGGLKVGVIGEQADLTYPSEYLGAGPQTLSEVLSGGHSFAQTLKDANHPLVIVGAGALARADGAAVHQAALRIAEQSGAVKEGWTGFGVLHTAASRVAGLDLGVLPGVDGKSTTEIQEGCEAGAIDLVILLGADELDMTRFGQAKVVYLGTHGDRGAHRADIILPGAAYTEKTGLYVNLEGRVQETRRAVFAPGEAKEDWAILRALSGVMGNPLPYDSREALVEAIIEDAPHFGTLDALTVEGWSAPGGDAGLDANAPGFTTPIADFYMTNPIARASRTMADCARQRADLNAEAHGGQHG